MSKYVREIDSIQQLRNTPTSDAAAAHVRTPTGQSGVFVPMDADPIGNGDDGVVALQASDGTWWVRKKATEGTVWLAWYGIGGSDDTNAINTARDTAEQIADTLLGDQTATLKLRDDKSATYNGELVVSNGVQVDLKGELIFGGTAPQGLTLGDTSSQTSGLTHFINVKHEPRSDWTSTETVVGCKVINHNNSEIRSVQSTGFDTGLMLLGKGNGNGHTAYNKFDIQTLISQKYGIQCIADGSPDSGAFCTENVFYGGRVTNFSGTNSDKDRYGIRLVSRNGSNFSVNNNRWYAPTFELGESYGSGEAVIMIADGAEDNYLYDVRHENNSDITVRPLDNSARLTRRNYVVSSRVVGASPKTDFSNIDNNQTGGYVSNRATTEANIVENAPVVLASETVRSKVFPTTRGTEYLGGVMAGIDSAGGGPGFQTSQLTLNETHIEIPNDRAVGFDLEVEEGTRFKIGREAIDSDGGRVVFLLFDSSDTALDNSTTRVVPSTKLQFFSSYHDGLFRTVVDSSRDVTAEIVDSSVNRCFVGVTGKTNPARIHNLSLTKIEGPCLVRAKERTHDSRAFINPVTDNTGGSTDGALASVAGSGDDATINNNLADLQSKQAEIITALEDAGVARI